MAYSGSGNSGAYGIFSGNPGGGRSKGKRARDTRPGPPLSDRAASLGSQRPPEFFRPAIVPNTVTDFTPAMIPGGGFLPDLMAQTPQPLGQPGMNPLELAMMGGAPAQIGPPGQMPGPMPGGIPQNLNLEQILPLLAILSGGGGGQL